MRQYENIFVFIDLTKSIGSDLGGQCPPPPPKQLRLCYHALQKQFHHGIVYKMYPRVGYFKNLVGLKNVVPNLNRLDKLFQMFNTDILLTQEAE